jgi:archaellum component FlaC
MKRIEVRVELDEAEAREFMDLIQDSRAVLDELLKEVRALKRKVREVEVAVKDLSK